MCVCVCVCVGVIELTYGTVQGYSRVATMAKKQGIEAGGLAMVGMEGVGGGGGKAKEVVEATSWRSSPIGSRPTTRSRAKEPFEPPSSCICCRSAVVRMADRSYTSGDETRACLLSRGRAQGQGQVVRNKP